MAQPGICRTFGMLRGDGLTALRQSRARDPGSAALHPGYATGFSDRPQGAEDVHNRSPRNRL